MTIIKMDIINKLKKLSQDIGDELFEKNIFKVDKAENDFYSYLCRLDLKDLPNYPDCDDKFKAIVNVSSISGFGNPFSPIIFFGNELAFDIKKENYPVGYFCFTIDYLWKSILSKSDDNNYTKLQEYFCEKWCGVSQDYKKNKDEPEKLYKKRKEQITNFYQIIRKKENLRKLPFCIVDSFYYWIRKGNHYWYVTEKLLKKLIENEKLNHRKFLKEEIDGRKNLVDNNLHYKLFCFNSEINLKPSTKTKNDALHEVNNFFKHIINTYQNNPRIVICGSHIRPSNLIDLFPKYNWHFDCSQTTPKDYLTIAYPEDNPLFLVVMCRNLSASVSNDYLDRVVETIKNYTKC